MTHLGVDVGGTFTDLVVLSPDGVATVKVPSTPADQSRGVLDAIDRSGVRVQDVRVLAHGMTVATNALLERAGARTALVTTHGFRDILEIARQDRPSLYDLTRNRPEPLVPRELRFTVRERVGPEGVIQTLDEDGVQRAIEGIKAAGGVESVVVCLLFSFLHPAHERRVGEMLSRILPGTHVSLSSEVLPEFREYERFSTTAADGYLGPVMSRYLERLVLQLEERGLPAPLVMQSSGGVMDLDEARHHAAACVLSGPAGGVVGAAHVASQSGLGDVLTFDMGGTSTDVAPVINSRAATTTDGEVAGVPIQLPMVDVHTVSAGGGSIAWADPGGALRLGPRSAGAEPGPACYGLGGTAPTVTDANLYLGYLADGSELGGRIRLDRTEAGRALAALGDELSLDAFDVARGIVALANTEMIRALRVISVERGLDPRTFALVAFGGAGPMHACALASELGMQSVLIPRAGGVLSALGLAVSEQRRDYSRPVVAALAQTTRVSLENSVDEMRAEAHRTLSDPVCEPYADMRYRGQSFEITVEADPLDGLEARFHAAHAQRYGYRMPDEPVEIVTLRLVARQKGEPPLLEEQPPAAPAECTYRRIALRGQWREAPVWQRTNLGAGSAVEGPAIVDFPEATCLVEVGWSGRIDPYGTLVLHSA